MDDHDIRARFAAANALLNRDTVPVVEDAREQFNDMLQLCRRDNLGVRDIIPHLLLRLGRDQECYDFLKWWATIDNKDHDTGRYDWSDATLPYLDIRGADVFEPTDMFFSEAPSLSHLVALTLLKLRLYLDLDAFDAYYDAKAGLESEDGSGSEDGFGSEESCLSIDRPVGRLVRAKIQTMDPVDISITAETLKGQYRRLFQVVHEANPFFWESLVAKETSSPASFYRPGSKEEADLVLHQCQSAWQDTEDAVLMVNAERRRLALTRVHEGITAAVSVGNAPWEDLRKGTGRVFPSRFEPPLPTSHPAELFPSIPMGRILRFICRNDRRKILVYADGACSNNGQLDPRAGWAVVCGTPGNDEERNRCVVSGRLEDKGPFGDDSVATSNRAELRAVTGALRFCDWQNEGYDSIVIATDSSYVVDGATDWAKVWVRNGWRTRNGGYAKNRDLWELLLGEVERWKHQGLSVALWKIPRELNGDADAAAKRAAQNGAAKAEFGDITLGSSQITTARTEPARVLARCIERENLFEACFGKRNREIGSLVH